MHGEAEPAPQASAAAPDERKRQRLVLLGASNLAMSLPTVVALAQDQSAAPLEILAATGYGRSYGKTSRVMARVLPSIVDCGLWQHLAALPPAPTLALLTDIGNDVLYGVAPVEIAGWVETCLERLAAAGANVVVTLLPISSIEKLWPAKYYFFRNLSYPGCKLSMSETCRRAVELNELVLEAAERRGATIVPQQGAWYGLHPVHIRRSARQGAWQTILSPWSLAAAAAAPNGRRRFRRAHLTGLRPERRVYFGRAQYFSQPSCRLSDGTTISAY